MSCAIVAQTEVGSRDRKCVGEFSGEDKGIILGLAKNNGYQRASVVGVSTGCRWRWCRMNE
jgi:hypothetical protein